MGKIDDAAIIADLLMRKYTLLKQEIWLHIGYYKAHVRNFQLVSGAIIVAGTYLFSNSHLLPNSSNWWFWWGGACLLPIVCNYLILDIVETMYASTVLGERLATLEESINRTVERRLLIWETSVAPAFWSGFRPMEGVVNPSWFLLSFLSLIVLTITVILPLNIYWILCGTEGIIVSVVRYLAIIFGILLVIFSTLVSVYAVWKVSYTMRGKPRVLIREMASHEVE